MFTAKSVDLRTMREENKLPPLRIIIKMDVVPALWERQQMLYEGPILPQLQQQKFKRKKKKKKKKKRVAF